MSLGSLAFNIVSSMKRNVTLTSHALLARIEYKLDYDMDTFRLAETICPQRAGGTGATSDFFSHT